MKKITALLISVLFILTATYLVIAAADGGYDGLYVVFGDSIAAGYGLDGSETGSAESMSYVAGRDSNAYAGIVSRALNYGLNNFAASGATTANMLNTLKTGGVLGAVAKADLVTVSIGGNDMIGMASTILPRAAMYEALGGYLDISRTDASIEQMYATLESNLTEIMRTLVNANNGKGKIYLQTLYNPFKYNKSYIIDFGGYTYNVGNLIDYYINRINEIYRRVRLKVGGFDLVDTATALNSDGRCFYEISTPDFHPTAFGHRKIAETILEAYEKPVQTTEATTATAAASSSVSTSEIVGSTTHEVTSATTTKAATTATARTSRTTTTDTTAKATVVPTTATTAEATTVATIVPTTAATTEATAATTAATAEQTTEQTTSAATTAASTTSADTTATTKKAEATSTVSPTAATTSTAATTAAPEEEGGCHSAITGGAAMLVISSALPCAVNFKKKVRK